MNSGANQRMPHGKQVVYHQDECRSNHGFDGSQGGLTEGISFIDIEGVDETKVSIRRENCSLNT